MYFVVVNHLSLSVLPPSQVADWLEVLALHVFDGVMHLEVLSYSDLLEFMSLINDAFSVAYVKQVKCFLVYGVAWVGSCSKHKERGVREGSLLTSTVQILSKVYKKNEKPDYCV